jgi:hypothetical protein
VARRRSCFSPSARALFPRREQVLSNCPLDSLLATLSIPESAVGEKIILCGSADRVDGG